MFLRLEGITQRSFAKDTGLDEATVSRLLKGKHMPSSTTIHKVERATKKKVTWVDLIADKVGQDNI